MSSPLAQAPLLMSPAVHTRGPPLHGCPPAAVCSLQSALTLRSDSEGQLSELRTQNSDPVSTCQLSAFLKKILPELRIFFGNLQVVQQAASPSRSRHLCGFADDVSP